MVEIFCNIELKQVLNIKYKSIVEINNHLNNLFEQKPKFLKSKIDKGNQIIVAGDFNILPEDIDVYDHTKYTNDALFRIEIRKK